MTFGKLLKSQWFCKQISKLLFGGNNKYQCSFLEHVPIMNMSFNKVIFYLNMLCTRLENWILGDANDTCSITIQWDFLDVYSIVFDCILYPQYLSTSKTSWNVFDSDSRQCNQNLLLTLTWDKEITKKVSTCVFPITPRSNIIWIHVHIKIKMCTPRIP